ncbi:uracil-DNA glycosylase family protein [Sphingomonas aracearum]|uniref:Uracil-DNA glycosylase n=1 Tax=Sphingomonas aracearum TaxID=2283317 RepID=A0A369VWV2_9SPHN|nr:uracil-DNA glycosylase family protein [Sphingomonas aracearum]RDE06603.1 uracil-DNA glycosylase [Sphingomonas aracearum]
MGADQNLDWRAAAASLIGWWQEAGVEYLADESPRDWFAAPPPAPQPQPSAPAEGSPDPVAAPTALAPLPATRDAFTAWRLSDAAPEARWPGRPLAPTGAAGAALMILLDQPEREDAESGQLLSGAAGRLFDRMLAAIGLDRSAVYLASVATVRPAAGRVFPEVAADLQAIARHHVALAAPRRLLLMGDAASRAILSTTSSEARGGLRAVNLENGQAAVEVAAVATYHPRFLLDRPACKADAWRDLQMVIRGLQP